MLVALLLSIGLSALSAAQGTKTFTGTISDDMCAKTGHAQMRMGPTDAECTTACISAHAVEPFAGQKVRVVGALDAKTQTIRVESITRETRSRSRQGART